MKKSISFKLDGYDKKIVVNELSVADILFLFDQKKDVSFSSFFKDEILQKVCNLSLEEVTEMTPRELTFIWKKFKEVNNSFFDLGRIPTIKILLTKVQEAITTDFLSLYASSSNPAT